MTRADDPSLEERATRMKVRVDNKQGRAGVTAEPFGVARTPLRMCGRPLSAVKVANVV
jgi:hypothetical protein